MARKGWQFLTGILLLSAVLVISLYTYGEQPIFSQWTNISVLKIEPGDHLQDIVSKLEKKGLTSPRLFYLYARAFYHDDVMQAGEYACNSMTTPRHLLRDIAHGDVITYRLTVVEGWTFDRLRRVIDANPHLIHMTRGLTQTEITQKLGIHAKNLEGRFMPTTYPFNAHTTDMDLYRRAFTTMGRTLHDVWQTRDPDLSLKTPYEALILASMIERESAFQPERPRIAGVIMHRIYRHMPLQIDPTVLYGLGLLGRKKLSHQDIKKDTPYNTYLHKGLPPTPICFPSLNALDAALHPSHTQDLYFVATKNGRHVFSKTLKAHSQRIKRIYHKRSHDASIDHL